LFRLRAVRGRTKPSRDGAELLEQRVVVEVELVELVEPGLQGELDRLTECKSERP
jgi:hypothetical protein